MGVPLFSLFQVSFVCTVAIVAMFVFEALKEYFLVYISLVFGKKQMLM